MPLPVLLLVLLAALMHAAWNGIIKSGSDRYLDTSGVLAGAALFSLLLLPFLSVPNRLSWPYMAASALVHIAYFSLLAAAYVKGDMSVVYPIARGTAPALAAMLSVAALHEYPSLSGWLGASFICGGVVTYAFEKRKDPHLHVVPIALALLNGLVIALYTILDGVGVRLSGNALSYTCWGFILCAASFLPVAATIRRGQMAGHFKAHFPRILASGAFSLAAYTIALWAMTRAPIAAVAALRETAILFGILLAACKLKEKLTWHRAAACALIICGVFVIKLA